MKKSNIGIIGFGSIGERHYRNLRTLGITPTSVLTKRTDTKGVSVIKTREAFAKAGPYDAILICNETYKHRDTIRFALSLQPKAIFVEKPLAMKSADVRAIERMLRGKRVHLFVGYSRQFYEPYRRLKSVVAKKLLGKIYEVRISVGQDLAEWRTRDYRKSYSSKKREGGGVLLDLVHEVNFPAWLLEERIRISAAVVRKVSKLRTDAEDLVEALGVTPSGTVVSIHLDCVRKPARWACELIGEKGSALWDSESQTLSVATGPVKEKRVSAVWNDMFVEEMRFFLSLLKRKARFSNLKEAEADARAIDSIRTYGKA